jgi:hypothetical protein
MKLEVYGQNEDAPGKAILKLKNAVSTSAIKVCAVDSADGYIGAGLLLMVMSSGLIRISKTLSGRLGFQTRSLGIVIED